MNKVRAWIVVSVLTRAGVLLAIILGALWPTYLNLYYAYNNSRIVALSHGDAWAGFYRALQSVDKLLGQEHWLAGLFFGTPSAMTLFGVPFMDPLILLSLLLSSPEVFWHLSISLGVVILAVLVFGRGYCSFACPASLLFFVSLRLREKIEWAIPWLYDFRRELPSGLRFGILLGGTVAAVLCGNWVWSLVLPYSMISSEIVNITLGVPLGITFTVFVFIVLSDFLVFPGEFCRSACPLGLILGRMSNHALIRTVSEKKDCKDNCESCLMACDLALNPRNGSLADCNLCGRCIAVCPAKKLSIRMKAPFSSARAAVLIVILSVISIVPSDALAHHYHGLPHYGYFDNYPQVPIEEFIAGEGRFELNFTLYNFQGMQRADVNQPGDTQIFLVIFDLKNKKTYGGVAEIAIHSGQKLVAKWNQKAEQESIYFINTQIPNDDDLKMEVRFQGPDGKPVIISSPFNLPGEGSTSTLGWLSFGIIFLIVAMVFASKQKHPNRKKGAAR
ncbi:MAG: hypothetical protein GY847_07595 [Proteobacteria bacterium]|nr:hypothetical protein [Pseudomonadota bacterium]